MPNSKVSTVQNEYISIENYMRMIRYFEYVMKNYDK